MLWCFRAAIRHKARSIRSRACLARDTTMRLPRMFRRDVPEVVSLRFGHDSALTAIQAVIHYLVAASLPPEGFMNSGSSKYALACFGVLELVHEESVRGADFAKTQHSRFSQAERLRFFSYFSVRTEKYISPFSFKKKKRNQMSRKEKTWTFSLIFPPPWGKSSL